MNFRLREPLERQIFAADLIGRGGIFPSMDGMQNLPKLYDPMLQISADGITLFMAPKQTESAVAGGSDLASGFSVPMDWDTAGKLAVLISQAFSATKRRLPAIEGIEHLDLKNN